MENLKIHGSENPTWMMLNGLAILGHLHISSGLFFATGAILQDNLISFNPFQHLEM
jgi:hypothetical protein